MVLLRQLVHLNGGGCSGATAQVRARTMVGKSGQGGGGVGLLRFLYRAKGSGACG
jgi:hypothetical protein